jgi:glycosyltransferase involved in cell wall biosynthesis
MRGMNADQRAEVHRSDGQRALRICVVTETYPPEVNGVALTLARVVEGLRARGHEVTVVRPRQAADGAGPGASHDVLVAGLPIPQYPHLRLGLPAGARLRALWAAGSVGRPDIVHVATEGPLGASAVRAARRLALPVTSDFRTNFHAYTGHYGLAWLRRPILGYLRAFHNRTAATTVPTDALRRVLQRDGFENLAVVSRGVDVARFDPAWRNAALRQTWRVGDDDPVVLYVGRLAAEKNLQLLVRAFEAIRATRPAAHLVLVGDGPLRAKLQAQLPDAHFAGPRHGNDLAAHYASADLFVFPSLTETFGNVVAEAMASGLAVVAFDDAAAGQWIEPGRSGALVARDNEAQFVRCAVELAGSAATRRAMGQRARERSRGHGWDAVLSSFEALLHRAASSAAGGAATPAPASAPHTEPPAAPHHVRVRAAR